MKEIFQHLSHITYHDNDMGTAEKTIVLHRPKHDPTRGNVLF